MENNNFNINDVLKILSTMDKEQISEGLTQASKILNSPDADKIIDHIKNKNNRKK